MPAEGQGRRPHAACPSSCLGQTGHGERGQERRVSSCGQGPWGTREPPRSSALCRAALVPRPPLPPPSLGVSGRQEGPGSCFGVLQGCRTGSSHAGRVCRAASLVQLIRAPQGWELLPSGTPGCRGGGVPLDSALHPSPPAHQCQCHRGILPAGAGPGQPRCLPPHPAPVPFRRCTSQSKRLGSFQR